MARKGVLVSSLDIAMMTPARWLFEYVSLRNKELDQIKEFRRLAIGILGLNMFSKTRIKEEHRDIDEVDRFMPLVAFLNPGANDQLLQEYFEDLDVEKMMEDEEWEKKLDDPDSLIAELEIVDLENREWVVEENTASDSFAPDTVGKKIRIDG